MSERDALLVLNAVNGLGNVRISRLLEHFGSAVNVLAASKGALCNANIIPSGIAEGLCKFSRDDFLRKENKLINQQGIEVISRSDGEYPSQLKEISDAPILLYIKGDKGVLKDASMAIVGSRKASVYGTSIAYQFSSRLAEIDFNVISGMARGIDTFAHRGCLKSKGKTVGVLGCGLAVNYPKENKALKEEVCVEGALVSEFPMETEPLPYNFPRRNRIISGLSLGTIVVEAAQRSGALITADFALEQGREVYAVPGKIDSPCSKGVNDLIKQGAKLITCIEDVIEDLSPQIVHSFEEDIEVQEELGEGEVAGLNDEQKTLLEKIRKKPVHINELLLECNSINQLSSQLLNFELQGIVKQLPGQFFVRK